MKDIIIIKGPFGLQDYVNLFHPGATAEWVNVLVWYLQETSSQNCEKCKCIGIYSNLFSKKSQCSVNWAILYFEDYNVYAVIITEMYTKYFFVVIFKYFFRLLYNSRIVVDKVIKKTFL